MRNRTTKKEEVVEVDPEMLKVLERLSDFNLGAPNSRSLSTLKTNTKKRQRADVQREFEIEAMIAASVARKETCSSIFD